MSPHVLVHILHQNRLSFIAAPSFVQEKCKANVIDINIAWEPIEYDSPVTAYVLELGQNDNNFNEVCFLLLILKE